MSMDVSFGRVRALDAGVWVGTLKAAEAARLPGAPLKNTGPHVVPLDAAAWNGAELRAPFEGVRVAVLGAGDAAIYLSAAAAGTTHANGAPNAGVPGEDAALPTQLQHGPGDDDAFVAALDEIGSDMARTGKALIARIRDRHAGALRRTPTPRLFVETPDNFWSVEVQPRRCAIKLVVRTSEERLLRAGLAYESERPPSYWAMKIYNDSNIEAALRFLDTATRGPNEAV
jgi:hypothetical protein